MIERTQKSARRALARTIEIRLVGLLAMGFGLAWASTATAQTESAPDLQISRGAHSQAQSPAISGAAQPEAAPQPEAVPQPESEPTPPVEPSAEPTPPPTFSNSNKSTSPKPAVPPAQAEEEDSGGYNDFPDSGELETIKEPPLFLVALLWDLSLPLASTTDFTNRFSIQGFSIEVKYLGFGNFSLGGLVAWHTLSDKTTRSFEDGDVTVTGTQVRELSSNPLYLRAHYAFRDSSPVDLKLKNQLIPYVALGVGGSRVLRRADLGIQRLAAESWHWAVGPEVGIEYPFGPVSLIVSGRLNYLFGSGEGPEQLYANFNVGIGLE